MRKYKVKKVSIIIPIYQGQKYISRILTMTDKNAWYAKNDANVELILVNDSPDICLDVDFTKLKSATGLLINNDKNCGIHRSRINGIRQATGEYIIMLDQDDVLEDNAVKSQLAHIKDGNVVVANGYAELREGKKYLYKYAIMQYTVNYLFFYDYFDCRIISPGHCMIKKDCIPQIWYEHPLKNNGSDDFFLWLLLLNNKAKFKINRDIVYTHTYTGNNVSADTEKINKSVREIIQIARETRCIQEKHLRRIEKRISGNGNCLQNTMDRVRLIVEKLNKTSENMHE